MIQDIDKLVKASKDRFALSCALLNQANCAHMAEVGVYKGNYAEIILSECASIQKYYMIDPWRNLSDWNKPANKDNSTFEAFYNEAMSKTEFASEKREVLRGKTTEIIGEIPDNTLDAAYIDGDHTLKGISIDLINIWPKLKTNALLIGDDFTPSIWQHSSKFEPTLVFPFAIYFAEAHNASIYALPFNQFLIIKSDTGFSYTNLSGKEYNTDGLIHQVNEPMSVSLSKFIGKLTSKFAKRH